MPTSLKDIFYTNLVETLTYSRFLTYNFSRFGEVSWNSSDGQMRVDTPAGC
jgi:hypothetical protein